MPNFHTHWLVALQSIPPGQIKAGCQDYLKASESYRMAVLAAFDAVNDELSAREFKTELAAARDEWQQAVLTKNKGLDPDAIACFSAYMLGACGPDFWTLPSVPQRGPLPDVATAHFDLGHYNRTHRQFEVSVGRVGKKDDLKSRLEQAYFLGMATHFAADLVIHQLVNVSAGAYNLLEKTWHHEQARGQGFLDQKAGDVVALWSTHNKVEHYWDSYVRSCWLGDYGPLWGTDGTSHSGNAGGWGTIEPLGLPTLEALRREVAATKTGPVRAQLEQVLSRNDVKWVLERPLDFPWVFCDRVLIKNQQDPNHLEPFIYEVVVHEKSGAYPAAEVRGEAELAKVFVGRLGSAYTAGNPSALGDLARFWNLDTGLGLKVQRIASDTSKEVITRLDFVHASTVAQRPSYARELSYIEPMRSLTFNAEKARAFPVRKAAGELESFRAISEPDQEAFLDRIRLTQEARDQEWWPERAAFDRKSFFNGQASQAKMNWISVATASLEKPNKIVLLDVKHRLTLELRVPIADLGEGRGRPVCQPEKLGMFFAGDQAIGVGNAWTEETKEWLEKKAKPLDHSEEPDQTTQGLQYFSTRLLVNLENSQELERQVAQGVWNNVIPFKAHQAHYGRNFVIGTGRRYVLHPTVKAEEPLIPGSGPVTDQRKGFQFDPKNQYAYYDDLSPTEQVFFTLYPLVKAPDGQVYDLLSKERVKEKRFDELKRIDAVGFVKIVLLYQLAARGAMQLDRCFVDGLEVPVERVEERR